MGEAIAQIFGKRMEGTASSVPKLALDDGEWHSHARFFVGVGKEIGIAVGACDWPNDVPSPAESLGTDEAVPSKDERAKRGRRVLKGGWIRKEGWRKGLIAGMIRDEMTMKLDWISGRDSAFPSFRICRTVTNGEISILRFR